MRVVILENAAAVATYGAEIFSQQLRQKPNSVLGLATGSTPIALYQELVTRTQKGELSFRQACSFNLDEYWGLELNHPQSYRHFMDVHLFDHLDIDKANTHVPPSTAEDPQLACELYERAIASAGGIDMQLLGIGRNGHIGFNEPSSSLSSRTRLTVLSQETIDDNSRFFGADEYQPKMSITTGIGTILEAKKLVLLATGDSKAAAIKATIEGPVSASCPASALQLHPDAMIILDAEAASQLSAPETYKHIEAESQKLEQALGLH